jgi:hypothetical protein
MYVIGGYGATVRRAGDGVGIRSGPDKWTRKKNLPVAVHHQAQTVDERQDLFLRRVPASAQRRWRQRMGAGDNAWEYDPAADTYKALAPMPGKRCSAIAENVGGKIYVIGGVTTMDNTTDVAFNGQGRRACSGRTRCTTRRPTRGRQEPDADGTQPCVLRRGEREDLRHRRPHRPRLRHHLEQHRRRRGVRPGEGSVGRREGADDQPAERRRLGDLQRQDLRGGGEVQNERYSAAFRSLESYDPVANRWDILPSLPGAVHGNAVAFIGNRLHTVSGKMEGGGFADAPGKATADHSVMEMHAAGTQ